MNSKPLPIDHGAPVRIIAPGIAGARSVKWLESITVQSCESENFYQSRDYKILPPEATDKAAAEEYWDKTPALQDMPINSVIGSPQSGDVVKLDEDGNIEVRGYALPQAADGPVVKVEISVDDGKTWQDAELVGESGKWSWALWKARVRLDKGKGRRILSRATDKGGNTQRGDSQWNFRGVAYNGYGEARNVEVYVASDWKM
jgi:sulfite oxidase